jgi:hypothetical protein
MRRWWRSEKLPDDVTLHLQGRLPADGGTGLRARIAGLGLGNRVVVTHEPYAPGGPRKGSGTPPRWLVSERKGNRNHDLTVSNKIFDYHMAGLAVIASDLPGLSSVLALFGMGGLSV